MTAPQLTTETVQAAAINAGVCIRPISQRVTDTLTGEVRTVAMPCGATKTRLCPPCAERARRLRMHQCREGWHLTEEPLTLTQQFGIIDLLAGWGQPTGTYEAVAALIGLLATWCEGPGRRVRSTRHRQDITRLPKWPGDRSMFDTFTCSKTGRTYRPSMFLTLTLDSYGRVRDDGTPHNPGTYDYRRAALDALHFPKIVDRFFQNLRRCARYDVQYFATVEEQRRLAPHLHAAIRGVIPRTVVRQVAAATYHQVWWPAHDTPTFQPGGPMPAWSDVHGGYLSPDGGTLLPGWDKALDQLAADPNARSAHTVRLGAQVDVKGIIPGPKGERAIGYLCKYLPKDMGATYADTEDALSARQRAHLDRLHDHIRWLPCSPECANWLVYGVQPKTAHPGMVPGSCGKAAHDWVNAGIGGRRVLVSRRWTGKTLAHHRADRATVVRAVLEEAGIDADDHHALARERTRPDGQPRWHWTYIGRHHVAYTDAVLTAIETRQRWRNEYDHAQAVIAARDGPQAA